MGRESLLWQNIRDAKLPGIWRRVENSLGEGTPDVCFAVPGVLSGWLELKFIDLPKRDSSKVLVDITFEQVKWATKWEFFGGGYCGLLVGVPGGTAYLFRSAGAYLVYGGCTKSQFKQSALWCGPVSKLIEGLAYD